MVNLEIKEWVHKKWDEMIHQIWIGKMPRNGKKLASKQSQRKCRNWFIKTSKKWPTVFTNYFFWPKGRPQMTSRPYGVKHFVTTELKSASIGEGGGQKLSKKLVTSFTNGRPPMQLITSRFNRKGKLCARPEKISLKYQYIYDVIYCQL